MNLKCVAIKIYFAISIRNGIFTHFYCLNLSNYTSAVKKVFQIFSDSIQIFSKRWFLFNSCLFSSDRNALGKTSPRHKSQNWKYTECWKFWFWYLMQSFAWLNFLLVIFVCSKISLMLKKIINSQVKEIILLVTKLKIF